MRARTESLCTTPPWLDPSLGALLTERTDPAWGTVEVQRCAAARAVALHALGCKLGGGPSTQVCTCAQVGPPPGRSGRPGLTGSPG
eukprot:2654054-Alexandrium_andersonii.AAC.1